MYWWADVPNFGDAIGPILAEKLLGIRPLWTAPEEADLVMVGSVLEVLPDDFSGVILGSGFISPGPNRAFPSASIVSVRGPLTKARVLQECAMGDPGLILSDVLRIRSSPQKGTALVPHYIDKDLQRKFPGLPVIDITNEPKRFLEEMSQFDSVITSSLHAMISADGLGISRMWIPHDSVIGNGFKFRDYSESIGVKLVPNEFIKAPTDMVVELKNQIYEAFNQAARYLYGPSGIRIGNTKTG